MSDPREESPRWIRTNQGVQLTMTSSTFVLVMTLGFLNLPAVGISWHQLILPVTIAAMVLTFPVAVGYMIVWYRWKHLHPVSFFFLGLFMTAVVGATISGVAYAACG